MNLCAIDFSRTNSFLRIEAKHSNPITFQLDRFLMISPIPSKRAIEEVFQISKTRALSLPHCSRLEMFPAPDRRRQSQELSPVAYDPYVVRFWIWPQSRERPIYKRSLQNHEKSASLIGVHYTLSRRKIQIPSAIVKESDCFAPKFEVTKGKEVNLNQHSMACVSFSEDGQYLPAPGATRRTEMLNPFNSARRTSVSE